MKDNTNLGKQWETVLRRMIRDLAEEGPIGPITRLYIKLGIYTHESVGKVISRTPSLDGSWGKSCSHEQLILDVSGTSRTGDNGTVQFLIGKYHCENVLYEYPIQFVATPLSESPSFLTAIRSISEDRRDIQVTVNSWDPSGAVAHNIPFDWHCRVPTESIIQ